MRDLRILLATLTLALFGAGCAVLPSKLTATTVGFEVLEFTQQAQFPGVESNLYVTEVHRVKLNGQFTEGAQRFELWVDSVALPARMDREKYAMALDFGRKSSYVLNFTANRHKYRPGTSSAMVLPEESYRLTGATLEEGVAWFVFSDRWGNETRWDLGTPTKLPNLYAP